MPIFRNNTALAILQRAVINLVQINEISIFAAVDEVKKVLKNGESTYAGDYKRVMLNLQSSPEEIDRFFTTDHLNAIHAFYTISNLPLREAFKLAFASPAHLVVKIPQNAQHSKDTAVSIILDITSHTVSVSEACESILNYFEQTRSISVLANDHLHLLRDINYYHIKYIFTRDFINNVTLLAEKQKLEYFIDNALDGYSVGLYQRKDDDTKSMSSAYRNWLACHEDNNCDALSQDSYFIAAVSKARANSYFAKHRVELEQHMVNHLQQNPMLLDKLLPAVSATLTMKILNHVAENVAAYEVGALAKLRRDLRLHNTAQTFELDKKDLVARLNNKSLNSEKYFLLLQMEGWMSCYTRQRCGNLLSQKNIFSALPSIARITPPIVSEEYLTDRLPEFIQENPTFVASIQNTRSHNSTSLAFRMYNTVAQDPVRFAAGLLPLFILIILINSLKKINLSASLGCFSRKKKTVQHVKFAAKQKKLISLATI